MTFGLCSNYDVRPALVCAEHQILDSEHANPTFDGNAAPTEPRVRLWFGKLGSSSNANLDRPRNRVTVNGELAIRPLLAGQRPSSLNATGSR